MDWISVKDRLPVKRETVLISYYSDYYGRNEVSVGLITQGGWHAEDVWFDELHDEYLWHIDVTHWMPLPDPPTRITQEMIDLDRKITKDIEDILNSDPPTVDELLKRKK